MQLYALYLHGGLPLLVLCWSSLKLLSLRVPLSVDVGLNTVQSPMQSVGRPAAQSAKSVMRPTVRVMTAQHVS